MTPDVIYAWDKNSKHAMVWFEVSGYGTKSTTFNFDLYEFCINGVIYTTDTPEWKEKISKLQIWEQLNT
jgi:hypothetical protein